MPCRMESARVASPAALCRDLQGGASYLPVASGPALSVLSSVFDTPARRKVEYPWLPAVSSCPVNEIPLMVMSALLREAEF